MTKLKWRSRFIYEINDNKRYKAPTTVGWSESSVKRKVHSNPGLFKEGRTNPNEQSNLTIIKIGKKEQMRAKFSRKRDIIKIREEINKIEKNKTIEKINETKN